VRVSQTEALPIPGGEFEWAYLSSVPFQSRYALAAWQVADIHDIVEIGGYRTPITQFLRGAHRTVTVLDPHIAPHQAESLNGAPCRVRHAACFFQDWADWPKDYALVMLGLDLELYEISRARRRKVLEQFTPVVGGAKRIVMEIPQDWAPSRWLGAWIEKTTGYNRTMDVILDIRGDLGVDLSRSWPPIRRRRVIVLERPGA
jgi:hypothetical protein